MTKSIYFLSGLGADERVFEHLNLLGFNLVYIQWLIPLKDETIEHYTTRLLEQIKTQNPILIGLSFGGIIAIEIAKQIGTEKVILIASAKTKNEIPFYYKWIGRIKLHKLLPIWLLKQSNFISNWYFGIDSLLEKRLLKTMLDETDAGFLRWAIEKIVSWKNETQLKNIYHLHGTNDRILPIQFVKYDFEIKDGGHFFIINKSEEVNSIITKLIEK